MLKISYRKEIKEGATILCEKIKKYRPKIAVFNGKGKFIETLFSSQKFTKYYQFLKITTQNLGMQCIFLLFIFAPY